MVHCSTVTIFIGFCYFANSIKKWVQLGTEYITALLESGVSGFFALERFFADKALGNPNDIRYIL
ncbi:hypothetical protein SAMN04488542_114122 [Fontibacillus panacisegetis]|uniref:Uncharacterized protein n=1 Tax=Fontibacillus panacisegetis TaxID=670482 RepID=A0A1G7MXB8_9BACL|nr:hypothetical protein SAMN04488542_114122 [Fontibacillus panacisegetis]